MNRPATLVFAIAAGSIAPLFGATSCEGLMGLKLKNINITKAETVVSGRFALPQAQPGKGKQSQSYLTLPVFCRVAATIRPVPDSDIKIEVWLPEAGWNGNLQSVGNGAWAGTISYS